MTTDNNFRQAKACENCRFAGFKAVYRGGKRITGLCLHYQSVPHIDYHLNPGTFPQLLSWFHDELRHQEVLNPKTFDEVWLNMPKYRSAIHEVYRFYLTGEYDEFSELPTGLSIDDWPLIVAKRISHGRWLSRFGTSGHPLNINGQTSAEIVEPMREHYDKIVAYHRGWRDYFANSQITKIKRTTVCDLHEPILRKRKR